MVEVAPTAVESEVTINSGSGFKQEKKRCRQARSDALEGVHPTGRVESLITDPERTLR